MFVTGRRKRKQVAYRPVKTLPKVFTCPSCGNKTMKTRIKKGSATAKVICGTCGKEQEVKSNDLTEPVDAFGEFIDIYYGAQEYERLTNRAERLKDKQQYSELAFVYSYLADICENNSTEALKAYEETKSEEDLENAQLWKSQADEYRKESKDIFEKLELKELEDGIDEDNIYGDEEDHQFSDSQSPSQKPKKGRDLEDILDDKGFLEF